MDGKQHRCYFKCLKSWRSTYTVMCIYCIYIWKRKQSLKKIQDFLPTPSFCCLLVKAAFLLGLLNVSGGGGVLIVGSQRQGGPRAAHPSPWVCMKGGLGRPQPVLLPLFTKRLGAGWTTPLSAPQYNRKQGSGKILETRSHTCRSLDLGGSTLFYLGDTRRRKRGWGGEGSLLATTADFWMDTRNRRRRMKKFYKLKDMKLYIPPNNKNKRKQTRRHLKWVEIL